MCSSNYLFVYGTLRKDTKSAMHKQLAEHCQFYQRGTLQGRLFDVDQYPGVIQTDTNGYPVHGEVYRVLSPQHLFSLLDDYEGCTEQYPQPHEYVRSVIPITLEDNTTEHAWTYLYTHPTSALTEIHSGDYLQYLKIV